MPNHARFVGLVITSPNFGQCAGSGSGVSANASVADAATLVLLMFAVAISSFWIHEIRLVGPFSPIHLLSIFAPIMLVLAVLSARRHNVSAHKKAMASIFFGALVVAGAFTFMPGRIMHAVVFGH